jgi:hypothetical protein
VLLTPATPSIAAEGIRCGAKLVKADLKPVKTQPEVRVLDNANRWRLLREEDWTGTNAREFYFTLQADDKLPPPTVEVRWPGVRIARVFGTDGNFPNGHEDYPPHFHIMLAWPGWLGTQAGHFQLDDAGRILRNELQADDGKKVYRHDYGPSEACPMRDRNGKAGFELIITEGGRGVIMRRAAGEPGYQPSPDAKTGSAIIAVEISRRTTPGSAWEPLCRVRATDDAARGEMNITVLLAGGVERTETIRYDPDTGEMSK